MQGGRQTPRGVEQYCTETTGAGTGKRATAQANAEIPPAAHEPGRAPRVSARSKKNHQQMRGPLATVKTGPRFRGKKISSVQEARIWRASKESIKSQKGSKRLAQGVGVTGPHGRTLVVGGGHVYGR